MMKFFKIFTVFGLAVLMSSCAPASNSAGDGKAVLEDIDSSATLVLKSTLGSGYFKFPDKKMIVSFNDNQSSDMVNISIKKVGNTYYHINSVPAVRSGSFSGLIGTWVIESPNIRQEITLSANTVTVTGYTNGQPVGDPITGTYSGSNGIYTMISSQGTDSFIYTGNAIYLARPLTIVTGNDIPPVFR